MDALDCFLQSVANRNTMSSQVDDRQQYILFGSDFSLKKDIGHYFSTSGRTGNQNGGRTTHGHFNIVE